MVLLCVIRFVHTPPALSTTILLFVRPLTVQYKHANIRAVYEELRDSAF